MTRRRLVILVILIGLWRLLTKPIAWARYWQYFKYVARHKWFVLVECLRLGVPLWQAIAHDWSKLTPLEWRAYAETFRTPDGKGQYKPSPAFDAAWNHHQKLNKHHWQYWCMIMDVGEDLILPMPDRHRREMLADWRGAGRALGKPDTKGWYLANRSRIRLHSETRAWIESELGIAESAAKG